MTASIASGESEISGWDSHPLRNSALSWCHTKETYKIRQLGHEKRGAYLPINLGHE